jgi:hypothetical protein
MTETGWLAVCLLFGPQTVKTDTQIIVLEERKHLGF